VSILLFIWEKSYHKIDKDFMTTKRDFV
jgi:hypothetical protein